MTPVGVLIKDAPAATPAAMRYVKALCKASQSPIGVFFFGRGVLHAASDLSLEWQNLQQRYNLKLTLCSASADAFHIKSHDGFQVEGLGELISDGVSGARFISFG